MKIFGYTFNKKAFFINAVALAAPLLDIAAQNVGVLAPFVSPKALGVVTVVILTISTVWHQFSPLFKKEAEELPDDPTTK